MDLRAMMDGGGWTEERHAAFLNWIEESFVHRMFSPENSKEESDFPSSCLSATSSLLPLDRHLPDSATESTRDLPAARRRSRSPVTQPARVDKDLVSHAGGSRTRKRRLSQHHALLDQVVPQFGIEHGDGDSSKKKKEHEVGEGM